MAFDISKFATSAPRPVSESDKFLEISVEKIVDNPKNFYPRPDGQTLAALQESIEANGLLEPPTVVPVENGQYRLISGHSRMAAIRSLRTKDGACAHPTHRWDAVLCRVLEPMSEDAELSAVIEANRQRVKSPALLADEAERLTESYRKRQEAGEVFPGGIQAAVAVALQVSRTKIANGKAIKAGLKVPGIIERWEHGDLPEASALLIAKMDIDQQYRLVDWVIERGKSWSIRDVTEFLKHEAQPPESASEPIPEPKSSPPLPTEPPECQTVIVGWMPGGVTPVEPGEFAVLVDLGHALHHKILKWDGAAWTMNSGVRAAVSPVYWLRLPPVPKKGDWS